MEGAAHGMARVEGSHEPWAARMALPWGKAELLFMCQKSNKQKAGGIEEVWGGGSYFLDPDYFLGSFQREEKKTMRPSLSRKSPLRASGPILEASKVRPRNTR